MKRLEATISGRVQGVGFRAYTQQQAQTFNISGWVRNNTDRSVSVVGEGLESDLLQFEDALKQGPRWSTVENIDITYGDATDEFTGFTVRR